jgi:hypothetical protein
MLEMKEIVIEKRSMLCECKMKWFNEWIEKKSFKEEIVDVCDYNERIEGKFVKRVNNGKFNCDDFKNKRIKENNKKKVEMKGGNVKLI